MEYHEIHYCGVFYDEIHEQIFEKMRLLVFQKNQNIQFPQQLLSLLLQEVSLNPRYHLIADGNFWALLELKTYYYIQ
jgi:hypothetical protein